MVSPHGSPIQTAAVVNASTHDTLGAMLTDSSGRSVYLFTNDQSGVSNCSGGCALAWPPLLTVDEPVAGEGVSSSALGSFTRSDGSKQVTYNDWPLYNFVSDAKPGDTNGQDVGDVWFVVDPSPPLTLALEEQNDSSQSGSATLTSVVNRTLVQLDLLPGPTESELVHIHSGSCGADLGDVTHDLANFVDGSGSSATVVEATLASLREGTFAINSHKKGEPSVYTTCGNIPPIPPPVQFTNLDEFGFTWRLDGAVDVQSTGWTEAEPSSTQGLVSFAAGGVNAILIWSPAGDRAPLILLRDTYNILQGSQPNLTFESITEGELNVSGEEGIFGGFTTEDASGANVGGGLIGTWLCSLSGTAYRLTVQGSDATVVQLRFNRLLSNFTCPSS